MLQYRDQDHGIQYCELSETVNHHDSETFSKVRKTGRFKRLAGYKIALSGFSRSI